MPKKLSIEEIKERLKEINPNIEVLGEFAKEIGQTKKRTRRFLKCRCLIDNCEWDVQLSRVLKDRGCPKCGGSMKLTLDEIKERLNIINPNISILEEFYKETEKRTRRYLHCKCLIDENEWDAELSQLLQGRGCNKCGRKSASEKQLLNLEEIQKKLSTINPSIEIISHKYHGNKSKLKCKCLVHNHVWSITWADLSQNKGCPKCAIERRCGENNWNWNGGVTPLYEHLRAFILPWKKDSIKASDYKCVITGKRFDTIHHLHGFDKIVKETMNTLNLPIYDEINKYTDIELKQIDNLCLELHYVHGLGVTLTKEIHDEFHNIYGYGDNTPEQFEEFKQSKLFQKNVSNL